MNPNSGDIWRRQFDGAVDEDLYREFKRNAEALTVTVLRAANGEEAAQLTVQQLDRLKVQQVVAEPLDVLGRHVTTVGKAAASAYIDFTLQPTRETIERADMGISQFDMGVARLGSIFQDASALHRRMVSMLPPIHLALLPTYALVESFAEALEKIRHVYDGHMPPYLSFITGPSKTADIERELTIGVHGPETLIVLCIDKPEPAEVEHHAGE
jgi:L-lactate dehydrogenase complex protein LldG